MGFTFLFQSFYLTPSLPICQLKTTNKCAKFETCNCFCLIFHIDKWKDFHRNTPLKVDVIGMENILFAGVSVHFQPGNFAGDYSALGVLESREYRYNYGCHCKALRAHLEMRSSTSVHKIITILTIHKQASFSCSHAHSNECRQLGYINARFLCQKLRTSFCC